MPQLRSICLIVLLLAVIAIGGRALAQDEESPEVSHEVHAQPLLNTSPEPARQDGTDELLQQILASEEFQVKAAGGEPWINRVIAYLVGLMSGWTGGKAGTAFYYIGLVLIGLVIALIVYLLVRLLWGAFSARGVDPRKAAQAQEEHFTTGSWLAAAEEAWKRGDYRSAIRYRFKALLSVLDLPREATLTNYQIARFVGRDHPLLRPALLELVQRFEDAWYGSVPADALDYELVTTLAGSVEADLARKAGQ